ncbi:guanine nucleotide binding protein, alpha subunit [Mycena albidolilacea]|uniref:Guanine nucleotide binding protein, alpha subunit n=1 Tax=Mycena albidolilacea TaxID=1033008 RepID=A0AAD6Z5B3_9AGAR|nr:guanine nucleotide binding protein, alpha subunit [Mycena albidolilacea]
MRSVEEMDPISVALAPPQNESPEVRQTRILMERAAKAASDEIDAQLNRERQQAKRLPKAVKILLLGQSESGKSTTLKNFQLMCEPKAFTSERASWRAIIQLNVIRSVRIILDALMAVSATRDFAPTPRSSYSSYASRDSLRPDSELLALRIRLLSVLELEDVLKRRLATPEPECELPPSSVAQISTISTMFRRRTNKEVAVNSSVEWKSAFMRDGVGRQSLDTENGVDWEREDDPGPMLHARCEDMQKLWGHSTVRAILERQGIRLQESPGFFLDELEVVTSLRYAPTDDHILRARLKTLGVSEHRMHLTDPNGAITRELRFFDVGGQRSMRAKWVPYFDDMDAIIFLAPISAFDQTLAEDPSVNRLADSAEIWRSITSNKILEKTNMIIFLNKVDILEVKLASGIRFADHFPNYGRRPNDYDSVSRYIRKHFQAILKQSSPSPRMFYCHLTNVIDTKSTAFVLAGIQDMLMRFHLKESQLIL